MYSESIYLFAVDKVVKIKKKTALLSLSKLLSGSACFCTYTARYRHFSM